MSTYQTVMAHVGGTDDRYPIMLVGPDWWEKLSITEAKQLAAALHNAIAQAEVNKEEI